MCNNRHDRASRKSLRKTLRRLATIHGLRKDASGSATTEYAIILAIIVGAALMASRFLGESTDDVFAKVFSSGSSSTSVVAAAGVDRDGVNPSAASAQAKPETNFFNYRLLAAEFIAFAALGSLWYVIHARRKRNELLGDDDEVPATVYNHAVQNRLFKKRQQIYRLLSENMDTVLASRMDVGHIMSHRVTTVLPSTPDHELREMMQSKKLRHLLVCDAKGALIGILSDRDVYRDTGSTAAEMMTANPITISPNTPIGPAVTIMIDKHISCLPVVDADGSLCAVLTSTDLMMALQCAMQILHKLAGEIGSFQDTNPGPVDAFGRPGVVTDEERGAKESSLAGTS